MFDWNAAQYSKFKKERTIPAVDLANAINHKNVRSVLDIGCGIGNSTAVLAKKFPNAKIVGADNSDDMLADARKNNPNIEFIKLDAEKDIDSITEIYNLSASQAEYLKLATAGHGLLKMGNNMIPFENTQPQAGKVYKLISTKPGECD